MKTEHNISYHLAGRDDAALLVNFHNSYYKTTRSPEQWLWEYASRSPEKTTFSYAKQGEKIIATQGMIPIILGVSGKKVLSGKSESTLLLPDYRGTQTFTNLYEFAVEECIRKGLRFIWGFTLATKAFDQFGFASYPDIFLMMRPGNILTGVTNRLKKNKPLKILIGSTVKYISTYLTHRIKYSEPSYNVKNDFILKQGMCYEPDIEKLFSRLTVQQNNNLISLCYKKEYLDWRVRQNPFLRYDEFQVYDGSDLKAYAIVASGDGVVTISDITSEDPAATTLLIQNIINKHKRQTGEFRFLGNAKDILSQDIFNQLANYGFVIDKQWNLVLRDLTGGEYTQIFDIKNWHINALWTEGVSM